MTRRPFKWVPLLLPRSTNENSEPPCACTKAWRRDTLGEVKTTLLSFARPSENVFPTRGNCRSPISSQAASAAFSIPPQQAEYVPDVPPQAYPLLLPPYNVHGSPRRGGGGRPNETRRRRRD